jgi:hypothetical protein
MKKLPFFLLPLITALLAACTMDTKQAPDPSGPDPMATVRELLRLHDLLGKQPEERPHKTKNKEVSTASLEPLFVNLETYDPFLRELYVGFVVGALARYQGRLFISKHENEAAVSAGNLKVRMKLKDHRYKIDLEKTIPDAIRQRANKEKNRYQKAKNDSKLR